jgi:hypothetical protein
MLTFPASLRGMNIRDAEATSHLSKIKSEKSKVTDKQTFRILFDNNISSVLSPYLINYVMTFDLILKLILEV